MMKRLSARLLAGIYFIAPFSVFGADDTLISVAIMGWDDNIPAIWKLDDGKTHSQNGGTFNGMIDISGVGTSFTGTDVTIASDQSSGIRVSQKGRMELGDNIKITSILPPRRHPALPEYSSGQYGAVYVDDASAVIGYGADIYGAIAIVARNNAMITIGRNSTLRSAVGMFGVFAFNPTVYINNAKVTVGAGTNIFGNVMLSSGSELILNGEEDNRITIVKSDLRSGIGITDGSAVRPNILRGKYVSITGRDGISSSEFATAQIELENSTINTSSRSLFLAGTGNTAALTNVDIKLTKLSDDITDQAVFILNGASLVFDKGTLISDVTGLYVGNSTVQINGVKINAFKEGISLSKGEPKSGEVTRAVVRNTDISAYYGIMFRGGAVLDMTDSTIRAEFQRIGLFFNSPNYRVPSEIVPVNTANLIRSTVNSTGYGIYVGGSLAQVNLDNSIIRDMNTNSQRDSGLYRLDKGSYIFEPTHLELVADHGSKLYGRGVIGDAGNDNGKLVANVTLRNNSFWYVDGDSKVTDLVNNGSTVSFKENKFVTSDDKFVNMVVRNNYTGQNGTIVLNARLNTNNDDSPHDTLLIQGDAYGVTNVELRNRGGNGGQTDSDDIVLITVNGRAKNDSGTFKLKSDYTVDGVGTVQVGLYNYFLKHRTQQGVNEWYLVSDVADEDVPDPVYPDEPEEPLDPVDPVNPAEPGDSVTPGNPHQPGNGRDKETGRTYGASIPLYDAYGQVLQQLNGLSTLHERTSGRTYVRGDDQSGVDGRGFWLRVEGATGHFNSAASRTGARYDLDRVKTQMGLDADLLETRNGMLVGGVYAQYGHGKADISSRYGNGEIKTDSYGFGGTLTWYQDNGFYIDGQAQAQWFDSSIYSRSRNGERGFDRYAITGNKGFGYALSLEGGRTLALSKDWSITPQAQLVYNHVDFDNFRDMIGLRIGSGDGGSLVGRVGAALEREARWQSAKGDERYLKVYGSGNFYHEFLDGTSVSIAFSDFRNKGQRGWAGVGAGTSYSWGDDKYALYGEVNTRTALDDFGKSYDVQATAGVKVRF